MRIVVVTTFFPNRVFPLRTLFVKNLAFAMKQQCELQVIAPVPYALPFQGARWFASGNVEKMEVVDGVQIAHPRYLVLPLLNWLTGFTYFVGVLNALRKIKNESGDFLVHAHCAYPDGVGVALAARLLGLPYAITAHGSDINVYAMRRSIRPQVHWALAGASRVIAVSRALEEKILALLGSVSVPLACIPCAGFDPTIFLPRTATTSRDTLGIPQDARLILFVGNLVPVKGIEFLINAWIALEQRGVIRDTDRLVIAGKGPSRAALEAMLVDSPAASTVHLIGAVPQTEISNLLAVANLLCLPSISEGTPNAVVEALAMGIPVVASRVGGVPELVREPVNGLLVEPAQINALADALEQALGRSWDAQQIRESVSHLTWQALAARNYEFLCAFETHGQQA